jgi:hypothetical protein
MVIGESVALDAFFTTETSWGVDGDALTGMMTITH